MQNWISKKFYDFISQNCDRKQFILNFLESKGIKAYVLQIDGRNHIYPVFPKECYSPFHKIKTIIAHYDRVPESPGANDNSFAVFMLMNWAETLNNPSLNHNVRLIFTDGEEIGSDKKHENSGTSIKDQGAFGLASVFKRLDILNDYIFVFDCMGRGTVPVLGKLPEISKADSSFKKKLNKLHQITQSILLNATNGKWLCLPVSYSDNAGFIASGISAVVITMLPQDESEYYLSNLMKEKELENFVTNKTVSKTHDKKYFLSLLPKTWLYFHTKYDNDNFLTQESISVFNEILYEIANRNFV